MKDEALKLALEALENFADVIKYDNEQDDIGFRACCYVLSYDQHSENCKATKAITATKQALAAQREHEPENEPYVSLASVQEPVAWLVEFENGEQELHFDKQSVGETQAPLYTTPPAQPAPVQEPVAWVDLLKQAEEVVRSKSLWKKYIDGTPLANDIAVWMASFAQEHATPPAQPAVPDAMTSADIQEHIEYVAGWNDCRQAMMEMMK
jgi:hypothetical protein